MKATQRLHEAGQSLWLDHITRALLASGTLARYVKELGKKSCSALVRGDTATFGSLLHEHWERKRKRSTGMSNPKIDEWYEVGRNAGAIGGKLVGAGGGGFLMFYAEDKTRLRHALTAAGLKEVRFRFDFEGTKSIV